MSGNIFVAGGGYYSRAMIVEGVGRLLRHRFAHHSGDDRGCLARSRTSPSGQEFGSATEQTGKALSHLKFD